MKANHIATREIILNKQQPGEITKDFRYQLIPLFNIRNSIIGTQLVECAENPDLYIFDNKDDTYPEKISINPLVEKLGYKLNRSKITGEMKSVIAYAKISENLIDDE